MSYRAIDMENNICIYEGSSKASFILEMIEHLENKRKLDPFKIQEEDVFRLNVKALSRAGVKISFSKSLEGVAI